MRPRYQPPIKKRYFHKKRRIDKKDMSYLKKRIEHISKKKVLRELNKKKIF